MPDPLQTRLKRALSNDGAGPRPYIFAGTAVATAGAATYTAASIGGGYILRDPNGNNRTDTLPTAALLVAYLRLKADPYSVGLATYVAMDFIVENTADAAETITVAVGTGGSVQTGHTMTIAQNNSKQFTLLINTSALTYTVFNRGTFTT